LLRLTKRAQRKKKKFSYERGSEKKQRRKGTQPRQEQPSSPGGRRKEFKLKKKAKSIGESEPFIEARSLWKKKERKEGEEKQARQKGGHIRAFGLSFPRGGSKTRGNKVNRLPPGQPKKGTEGVQKTDSAQDVIMYRGSVAEGIIRKKTDRYGSRSSMAELK